MIEPRLVLCSGISIPPGDLRLNGRKVLELDALGHKQNVNLVVEDVVNKFQEHLSPRLVDLLEIAAYVYTADCGTRRGTEWADDDTKEAWDRDFHFLIPVRDIDFWSNDEVQRRLVELLTFLSNDKFMFDFCPLTTDRPKQLYLNLSEKSDPDWPFSGVDRVLMFSGGLDSLAGAIETAAQGENLVLVSHRPVVAIDNRQKRLVQELRKTSSGQIIHVPVWVNKDKTLGREHTQRTRSFLFSSIGTVVAESVHAGGVRFFENGIVSLNLPVADEVLRARASRTTHPLSLELLTKFFQLVTGRDFVVDNPFIFHTKTEVVSIFAEHDKAHLIPYTCSCAHTGFFQSANQWHCGTCSQCIDRRVAMIATGLERFDPESDYVSDVFTGLRKDGTERNMAVDYARHAVELYHMSESEMAKRFNLHLTRATRYMPNRREAAQKLIQMHKRHGEVVYNVLKHQLEQNAAGFIDGSIYESSMISVVGGLQHLESSWKRYADRISSLLSASLPTMCKTHKPEDEPHLQELCDGVLKTHDEDLVREYPFMRWGAVSTKPDWSNEDLCLWVELKYVRKKEDIRPITEDIAADITKYGDNHRRVLYAVYDPLHLIVDERAFSAPIVQHKEMLVHFVR